MPSHSQIHIDVNDWDASPLVALGDDLTHSIGVVMGRPFAVYLHGTVAELDEALLRFGDSIVELRRRLSAREAERRSNMSLTDRALGDYEAAS